MFPTGFIGVCSLGVRKVIFGGFDKDLNFFFLKKDSYYFNMIHQNKSLNKLFFMGA
jgi:hypothetical protein